MLCWKISVNKISISFIGSGRVATQLAHVLSTQHSIQQIFSRQFEHAHTLASNVNAEAITDLNQLKTVDLLIIAVSDQAIPKVAQQLAAMSYSGLVVHTSGSTDLTCLTRQGLRAGVFYPLQTFSFGQQINWQQTPIFIESVHTKDTDLLSALAQSLTTKIFLYSSAQRLSLHLAAVFACNFSNYCIDIAQQILQQQQVDPSLLNPLIVGTIEKLQHNAAVDNQTGPAQRHDQSTMELHHALLNQHVDWQHIYDIMSHGIQARHTLIKT